MIMRLYTVNEIGKELGVTGSAINKALVNRGITRMFNRHYYHYCLTDTYSGRGYVVTKDSGGISWTEEGKQFIMLNFKRWTT